VLAIQSHVIRFLLAFTLLSVACVAQLNFLATFKNTPSGDHAYVGVLLSADTANAGDGKITNVDGEDVCIDVYWVRNTITNVVTIYVANTNSVMGQFNGCPCNSQGGDARLNDGSNGGQGSPGEWGRT